jgi:hypothetical protein
MPRHPFYLYYFCPNTNLFVTFTIISKSMSMYTATTPVVRTPDCFCMRHCGHMHQVAFVLVTFVVGVLTSYLTTSLSISET